MNNSINDLNLLQTFCKVVKLGSFTKAANELNWPKSRVSRSVVKIETLLNAQLIRRTTRSFSLTEQGSQFYKNILPLINSLNFEIDKIYFENNEISGPIRITAPADICVFLLSDIIQKFSIKYPKTNVTLDVSRDTQDLVMENFDIAFILGSIKNLTYQMVLLTKVELIFVASKNYLKRIATPITKENIEYHRLLFLQMKNGPISLKKININPKKIFSCSNYPLLYKMVKSDFGIGIIPDFICQNDLNEGFVEQLFSDWNLHQFNLYLVYPSSQNIPKRVRLFIDFAKDEIKSKIKFKTVFR